jgi:hypothetical protein
VLMLGRVAMKVRGNNPLHGHGLSKRDGCG